MSQNIGQQNQAGGDGSSYATPITQGVIKRIRKQQQGTFDDSYFSFENVCLELNNKLQANTSYYVHAIIKMFGSSTQTYNIKLGCSDDPSGSKAEQQIKRIVVVQRQGTTGEKNAEIEFVFTPINDFYDRIIFDLERFPEVDYKTEGGILIGRTPYMAFIEISQINNKIPTEVNNTPLSKIGVQSHPDLLMCINGEEIHMSKSGIFELRDGILKVDFFSVIKAAKIPEDSLSYPVLESQLQKTEEDVDIDNLNLIGVNKIREIDAYTLDYMYETN